MAKIYNVGDKVQTEIFRFSTKIIKGKRVNVRTPIKITGKVKSIKSLLQYGHPTYTITGGKVEDFTTRIIKLIK